MDDKIKQLTFIAVTFIPCKCFSVEKSQILEGNKTPPKSKTETDKFENISNISVTVPIFQKKKKTFHFVV